MKNFHCVIGIFLFGICPILSYYIKDDSPKAGYVSLQNVGRTYQQRGFGGMQRRNFAGSIYKHKNENFVDSHFKVKKTPPDLLPIENRREEIQSSYWNTDAPIQQETKQHEDTYKDTGRQEPLAHSNQIGRSVDKIKDQPLNIQRSKPVNTEYRAPTLKRSQNIQMHNYQDIHQSRYDSKPSFVQMNVRKTQIPTDPQKIVRNSNQQFTSVPVHHRQEEGYQKLSTHSDRNSQIMSRALDEKSHKSDRILKEDYKKRGTEYTDRGYDMDNANRNFNSDTIRKYIIGKDKTINLERKSAKEFSRIGSHEDSIEPENSPYAIFYRMHPDTLDEQEGYISNGSLEENSNIFSNKMKRLSVGYENEVDLKNSKKKKSTNNSVKIHKNVKHYANYRTL